MCVALESLVEVLDSLVNQHLIHDFLLEHFQLLLTWKVSIEQEEASLQEGAVLGKLVNGKASVKELALLSINKCNLRNT